MRPLTRSAVLPVVNSLWIGDALSWIEVACLRSFVRHGHTVVLWTYGPVTGVPEGVTVRSAAAIMPLDRTFYNRRYRSWGPAASVFRYRLMEHGAGLWLDCDVYLRRAITIDPAQPLFGLQKPGLINNAVLYLPPESAILEVIQETIARGAFRPWWTDRVTQMQWRVRNGLSRALTGRPDVPWGLLGPRLLTRTVMDLGLMDEALPPEAFYPFGPKEARGVFHADGALAGRIGPATRGVHLWNNAIKDVPLHSIASGSLADRIRQGDL